MSKHNIDDYEGQQLGNMLNPNQFRKLVVRPTLEFLGMWSLSAENLMVGTALVESYLYSLEQEDGPALGFYQIEVQTAVDIHRYVDTRLDAGRKKLFNSLMPNSFDIGKRLVYDLRYATLVARLKYWMHPEKLPHENDIEALAAYWKKYYNTENGKGDPAEFVKRYREVHGG